METNPNPYEVFVESMPHTLNYEVWLAKPD